MTTSPGSEPPDPFRPHHPPAPPRPAEPLVAPHALREIAFPTTPPVRGIPAHPYTLPRDPAMGYRAPRPPLRRPGSIIVSALMSWAGSAALLFFGGVILIFELMEDPESSFVWIGAVIVALSAAIFVLAVLAFFATEWARLTLASIATVVLLLGVWMVVNFPEAGPTFMFCGAWSALAGGLNFLPGANRWVRTTITDRRTRHVLQTHPR